MCSLVTLPKLLASGISSPVSSFPVMMGSQRCAKKQCAWGALLTLAQCARPISKYHNTHTHAGKHTKQPPGKYWRTQRTPKSCVAVGVQTHKYICTHSQVFCGVERSPAKHLFIFSLEIIIHTPGITAMISARII